MSEEHNDIDSHNIHFEEEIATGGVVIGRKCIDVTSDSIEKCYEIFEKLQKKSLIPYNHQKTNDNHIG